MENNKKEKSEYYKLQDALAEYNSKLSLIRAEIEGLEKKRGMLEEKAINAFTAKKGFREKDRACRENEVAIKAKRKELQRIERSITAVKQKIEVEREKESGRIQLKFLKPYKTAVRRLYKALLAAQDLEAAVFRIRDEAQEEMNLLGPEFVGRTAVPPVPQVVTRGQPNNNPEYRDPGQPENSPIARLKRQCEHSGIDLSGFE